MKLLDFSEHYIGNYICQDVETVHFWTLSPALKNGDMPHELPGDRGGYFLEFRKQGL